MELKLISKFDGALIGNLNTAQALILSQGYTDTTSGGDDYLELLAYIRTKKSFVECNCLQHAENSPQLGTRQLSSETLALVNLPGRKEHARNCPLQYAKYTGGIGYIGNDKKLQEIVAMGADGRVEVDRKQLSNLYRSIIHTSNLNTLCPKQLSAHTLHKKIIDAAKQNGEFDRCRISPVVNISDCNDQLKRLKVASKQSGHLEYSIVFGLITHFDDEIIMRKFGSKKPFQVAAGNISYEGVTNIGPFVSTTIIIGKDGKSFPLATHIEPVFKIDLPIPLKKNATRELIDELLFNSGSLVEWLNSKLTGDSVKLIIPLKPLMTPLSDEEFLPNLILQCGPVNVFIGDPIGEDQAKYREAGCLVWLKRLSVIPEYRQIDLKRFKSRLAGAILKSNKTATTQHLRQN